MVSAQAGGFWRYKYQTAASRLYNGKLPMHSPASETNCDQAQDCAGGKPVKDKEEGKGEEEDEQENEKEEVDEGRKEGNGENKSKRKRIRRKNSKVKTLQF